MNCGRNGGLKRYMTEAALDELPPSLFFLGEDFELSLEPLISRKQQLPFNLLPSSCLKMSPLVARLLREMMLDSGKCHRVPVPSCSLRFIPSRRYSREGPYRKLVLPDGAEPPHSEAGTLRASGFVELGLSFELWWLRCDLLHKYCPFKKLVYGV